MPRAQHDSGDPSDVQDHRGEDRIADNRDRDADRVGDLPGDLEGDPANHPASDLSSDLGDLQFDVEAVSALHLRPEPEPSRGEAADEEVWFDPEALAVASQVELGSRGAARSSHDADRLEPLEQLRAILETPGISLADLPTWSRVEPHEADAGQALGGALAELLGELRAGDLILVSGHGRGVGRSSLLAQLSDAIALRSSPVLCMVDGPAAYWRARSVARWSGLDVRRFVISGHPTALAQLSAFAAGNWRDLDHYQHFADASLLRDREALIGTIDRLRSGKREVWPVLVIDPLEPIDPDRIATLEQLAGQHSFIVIASCDEPDPEHARRIDRHARARLRLSGSGETLDIELCHRRLGPTGSVRLRWDRASGRIGGQ